MYSKNIATTVAIIGLFGVMLDVCVANSGFDMPAQKRSGSERVEKSREILFNLFETGALEKCLTDKQISALILQESTNGRYLVGDQGNALGPLQVWSVYVDDVNKTFGTNLTNTDCKQDREISILVMLAYLNKYANSKRLGRTPDFADLARIHNGGPNGYKVSGTIKYWNEVSEKYSKLADWQVERMIPIRIQQL